VNIVIFGASGMVGQGVLRECLLDDDVDNVLSVSRGPVRQRNEKLREVIVQDFFNLSSIAAELRGLDACFFCLGVSSAGLSEEQYTRVTYDITLAAANSLLQESPGMTFIYVSGAGTDSSEKGPVMWARVKGRTENALLALGFRAAYMFRPGFIQPMHGIQSKTRIYRAIYTLTGPLFPLLRATFPRSITTTEQVGKAMLAVAKNGYPRTVLEARDISRF
jgi:uncharacterized protein YbjT (DUF2867 family)